MITFLYNLYIFYGSLHLQAWDTEDTTAAKECQGSLQDTPGTHTSSFLPILDTQLVVQDGKFIHEHYAKLMVSLEVILYRTAMSV